MDIAGILQATVGLGQRIYGNFQKRRALRALTSLEKERPRIELPPAFRKLAEEPIAESFMRAQTEALERQTGQYIDAASRMGSRALLGALPYAIENERIGNQQLLGTYNQAYTNALSALGNADFMNQRMMYETWLNRVKGGRGELDAANQNIFYGLANTAYGVGDFYNKNKNMIDNLLKNIFKIK